MNWNEPAGDTDCRQCAKVMEWPMRRLLNGYRGSGAGSHVPGTRDLSLRPTHVPMKRSDSCCRYSPFASLIYAGYYKVLMVRCYLTILAQRLLKWKTRKWVSMQEIMILHWMKIVPCFILLIEIKKASASI